MTVATSGRMVAQTLAVSARHQILLFLTARQSVAIQGVVQPAVFLLVALIPVRNPTPHQVASIAAGVLLISYWTSTVWNSASVLTRERGEGTLAASLTSTRDPLLILTGRAFAISLASAALSTVTIVAALALMHRKLSVDDPLWFAIALAAVLISGTAMGVMLACVFVLSRYGPQISSALMYPIFLFGGLLIPLHMLPVWLRWLSWPISLRWAKDAMVAAAAGEADLLALALVLVLTVAYALLGARMFRHIVRLALEKGTLDLV